MRIIKIIQFFTAIGMHNSLTPRKIRQIRLTNQITMIMVISAAPYYLIFHRFGLFMAANMVIITVFSYLVILFLNHFRKYELATALGIILQSVFVLPFYSIHLGFESGVHLMYIPLAILPIIFYTDSAGKWFRIVSFSLIAISLMVVLIHNIISASPPFLNVSSLKIIYTFAYMSAFGLVLSQLVAFKQSEKKMTQKLETLNHQLTDAVKSIKQHKVLQMELNQYADYAKLVQRIAHEFKNPLQMLQGTAELGARQSSRFPEVRQLFNVVLQTVDRLNTLIHPILNYLSVNCSPVYVPINIIHVVDDILMLSSASCQSRGIRVHVENELVQSTVCADYQTLGQVLINIISNAMDAIGSDGGNIRIHLKNSSFLCDGVEVDGLCMVISDTGCGMSAEDLSMAFIPYESTKGSKKNIGIGLSIVSKIIQDHGGLIQMTSTMGEGTSVFIWLKITDAPIPKPKKESPIFELSDTFFDA
ncbi:MAG: sensor histidine kinase [Candidatus Marinamargulisbacteria bacterium]